MRRERLEHVLAGAAPPVHLSPATRDRALAQDWFRRFEGAGLDGVMAKRLDAPYRAGERTMIKVKHKSSATLEDRVVATRPAESRRRTQTMEFGNVVREFVDVARAAPRRNIGALLVLFGVSVALAACSSVSGRTAERDRPGAPTTRQPGDARELRGQRAADVAMRYRGARYQWGSAGPSSFDCSGFVKYVYAQVGVSLPHNAAMQYRYGTPVSRDSLEPGDLVFFDRLRHNGIYIGQGRFIHARQTGKRVNIGVLDEDWYRSRWVGARRP